MNKWAILVFIAIFFFVIIYLRMEKEREAADKKRKESHDKTIIDQDD